MTTLEQEIQDLRAKLEALAERVRLDAVAEEFLRRAVTWRKGDVFMHSGMLHKLGHIYDDGRWLVTNMNGNSFEPHRPGVEVFEGAERLYTAHEVAEILAKSK